jgi:hypothetical protein
MHFLGEINIGLLRCFVRATRFHAKHDSMVVTVRQYDGDNTLVYSQTE